MHKVMQSGGEETLTNNPPAPIGHVLHGHGIRIANRHVGDGAPCLVVAEVAQAHDGSYATAHSYIDAVADAGCEAVKFQVRLESESYAGEPWRVEPKWRQDENRQAYWKRMEFGRWQWEELRDHAVRGRGLLFIASPFSVQAVERVNGLVDAWKVASGELTHRELLRSMALTDRPLILSTGMAKRDEILGALWTLGLQPIAPNDRRQRTPRAILHCVSKYPTPAESVGLNCIEELRRSFMCPIGLSDHSGSIFTGLAAVALGCDILEVHVKLSPYDAGPDASSSITVEELRQLVEGVRYIERAKRPVDKEKLAEELKPMRDLFMDRHRRANG